MHQSQLHGKCERKLEQRKNGTEQWTLLIEFDRDEKAQQNCQKTLKCAQKTKEIDDHIS